MTASPPRHLESGDMQRLRSAVGNGSAPQRTTAAITRTRAVAQRRGVPALVKAQVKRAIRRAIAWYVDPTVSNAVSGVEQRLRVDLSAQLPRPGSSEDPHTLATNQQLLKGEVRYVVGALNTLGEAIAPTGGLDAASARLAQLREQVNDVDRRLRRLMQSTRATASRSPLAEDAAPKPPAQDRVESGSSGFDYLGFERRFRGDSESLLAVQRERYLELLRESAPVFDVGCGRGELVGSLSADGIAAAGVDIDDASVAEAVAAGRNVQRGDALDVLRAAAPGSFGTIISLQVVEHMQLDALLEFLELAAQRLRPGGLFIAETPNPLSMIVLSTHYIMDPTHVRPLHPALLAFLCERAGFREIELRYFDPARQYWLPTLTGEDLPGWTSQIDENFDRLNKVLFGPQDYAVVARTPPAAADDVHAAESE